MKNITLLLLGLLLGFTGGRAQETGDIPINKVYFPDKYFQEYISDSIDLNHDGGLSKTERLQVSKITISEQYRIASLDGIRLFPNLQNLSLPDDNYYWVTNLDLSDCKNLELVCIGRSPYLSHIDLESLNLSGCTNLKSIIIYSRLSSVNLSGCANLRSAIIDGSGLSSIDLNGCVKLDTLICPSHDFSSLDLSAVPQLKYLDCSGAGYYSKITALDLSPVPQLKYLDCSNNRLSTLDLSTVPQLEYLNCSKNALRSLDLSPIVHLKSLSCSRNYLASLNLNGLSDLEELTCDYNHILRLDSLHRCTKLKKLDCKHNNLTYLNIQSELEFLECLYNPLYCLNAKISKDSRGHIGGHRTYYVPRTDDRICPFEQLPYLDTSKIGSYENDFSYNWVPRKINGGVLTETGIKFISDTITYCYQYPIIKDGGSSILSNFEVKLMLEPQGLFYRTLDVFSDVAFCDWVEIKYDKLTEGGNNLCEGILDKTEFQAVKSLNVRGADYPTDIDNIEIIDGLQIFPSLRELDCSKCKNLKILDLHINTYIAPLTTLKCDSSVLTRIDLSETRNLTSLSCKGNGRVVETDTDHRFDLNQLSHLNFADMQNLRGGSIDGNGILTFFQDTVWYEYPTNYTGANESIPQTLTFFLAQSHPNTPVVSDLPISQENFPDEKFRAYIQTHFDLDQNDSLSEMECLSVTEINVNKMGIKSLHGIQHFKNLKSLHADSNNLIGLDLSCNTRLESFSCNGNRTIITTDETYTYHLERALYPDFKGLIWSLIGGNIWGIWNDNDNYYYYLIEFDEHYTTENDGYYYHDTVITYEYLTNYRGGMVGPQLVTFQIINTYRPETSEQPEDPEAPEDPDDDPENPDDDPDNPENPGDDPDEPEEPENPTDPDTPDDPENPDEPDTPDDPDAPDYPITANEYTEAANLFSVHPVPFRNTLHVKTELNLQSVCLYNMQGRLCVRFEHGFDALPTAHLEPGLYLLLLETADGATYRLKAIKE